MNKLIQSTVAKIIACFFFTVSAAVFVLSTVSVIALSEYDVYFDDGAALRYRIYSNHVKEAEKEIINSYIIPGLYGDTLYTVTKDYFNERYSAENSNISINAETSDGQSLFSNDVSAGNRFNYSNSHKLTLNNSDNNKKEPVTDTVTFTASISDRLTARDKLFYLISLANIFIKNRYPLILVVLISFIVALFFFVFMLYSAGHRKDYDGIYLEPQDKIPFDLFILFDVGLILLIIDLTVIVLLAYRTSNIIFSAALVTASFLIDLLLLLALILTTVTRIKYGKWWENTVLYKFLHSILRFIKFVFKHIARLILNLPMFWKTAAVFILLSLFELNRLFNPSLSTNLFWWLIEKILVGSVIFFTVIDMKTIKKGAEEIASGNTGFKIQTQNMYGDFKKHAETLNKVNDGLSRAVNEKMKSERLKTELITNVSHDLKTPLTSIVNYVDLMKKEDIQQEKVKEYLEVLDRQSKKLRKLTLDLLEASKASSGNMAVETEPTDINLFLSQLEGEYSEKLQTASLTLYISYAENGTFINADGRLLSRVFDNIMNNICKYTQADTRVYVSAKNTYDKVEIKFKNISKYQLNISGDELMERFVRGDTSRTTEGSGLGLSIAKSLTELQGGTLDIVVDGDLFKAIVTMDSVTPDIQFSEDDF